MLAWVGGTRAIFALSREEEEEEEEEEAAQPAGTLRARAGVRYLEAATAGWPGR